MENSEAQQAPSPYLMASPILHSHNLTQVQHLKIYIDGEERKGLLLVKPTIIEIALMDGEFVYDWFQVPVYQPILKIAVIPSKYKRSDIVFVLVANAYVFLRWAEGKPEVLCKGNVKAEDCLPYEQIFGGFCGVQYSFNVNDTEGYIFFRTGPFHITNINFFEKANGFKVLSQTPSRLPTDLVGTITYMGTISQKYSKYKTPSLGVVFDFQGKSHLRLVSFNTPTLTELQHLKITRTNILHFLSGKDFLVITSRQILFYGYYSNKPTMTHRLPALDCVVRVLQLEDVYCAAGEQLILFTKEGTKEYGEITCQLAVHVGSNRLLLAHHDEDARLVQLEETCVRELHRWLNLSNIFSVEMVSDGSMETFVVVSPNRRKQLTILTKAQTARPLFTEQLEQPITKLQKVHYRGADYILVSLMDESMMLMKVVNGGLEEIGRLDFKLVAGVSEYVVLSTGIYILDYQRPTLELVYQYAVERASASERIIVLADQKNIAVFDIKKCELLSKFLLNSSVSALANTDQIVWISKWGEKQVQGRWFGSQEVWTIKTEAQVRAIAILEGHIFLGQSKGIVEVYRFDRSAGPIFQQKFLCGTLPVSLSILSATSLLCMSDQTMLICLSPSTMNKSLLSLKALSSAVQIHFAPAEHPTLLLTSCLNCLTLYQLHKTQQLNRHSLKVCEQSEMPFVKTVDKKAFVFRKEEVEIIDVASLERTTVDSEIEEVLMVDGCEMGVLVVGVFGRAKDRGLSYFRDGREAFRYALKKMPFSLRYVGKGRILLGGESEIKILSIDESIPKISDLSTCSLSINCIAATANLSLNKLLVADPFKTIVLYDYPEPNGKLTPVARACCDRICNDIAFMSTVMLACDKSSNLLSLQPNLKANNDLEKTRLDVRGGLNLGEEIWTFTQKQNQSVIYGTGSGTIGKVREIQKDQYQALWEIQKVALKSKLVDVLGTADRGLKMPFLDSNMAEWKNAILDGELLKGVARLQHSQLKMLLGMTNLTTGPTQILRIIEAVCT